MDEKKTGEAYMFDMIATSNTPKTKIVDFVCDFMMFILSEV